MSQTFKKAPLVEIIAEAKWTSSSMLQSPGIPQGLTMPGSTQSEEFYIRFGVKAHLKGFQSVERLVPSGFPIPQGNVVYRYRQGVGEEVEQSRTELWQVGPGVFAANATPPYRSWTNFEPIVRDGIEALLQSRALTERDAPFSTVSLRYIDAFGPEFLIGRSVEQFMGEVLGFSVNLPKAVSEKIAPGSVVSSNLQIAVPLDHGLMMAITLTKGPFNNEESLMMDTMVRSIGEVAPDVSSVMEVFERARSVIHETFFKVTEQLHSLMGLQEE
jgi:uncharacterized protein (TIGR04255 family)